MDEIESGVFSAICTTFRCDPALVTLATQADDIDGWDSLSHAVLLVAIERRFSIRLDYSEAFEVANVGGLIDMVSKQTRNA